MKKGGKNTRDADGDPIVLSDTEYPLVHSPIKKAGGGNKRRQMDEPLSTPTRNI